MLFAVLKVRYLGINKYLQSNLNFRGALVDDREANARHTEATLNHISAGHSLRHRPLMLVDRARPSNPLGQC